MVNRLRSWFPRVVQFGPPRTGSTLVWNAMRLLLPGETIPKRHDLNPLLRHRWYPCRMVCTVRNPLDAIASSIRRYGLEPSHDVIASQIGEFQRNGMNEIPALIGHRGVLFLRYEEVYQDFDRLFDRLQDFLQTGADVALRDRFKAEFDVRRIKQASDRLGGFGNFSTEDHIHGGHVSDRLGEPGGHVDMLDGDAVRMIREAFAWHFTALGYADAADGGFCD
jgi:hypothetical protein